MTLLVDEVHVAPVVALNLWVGTGSSDEPALLSGVSHFLEHMLLKGSEDDPRGPLARTVQDAGGYLNARTGCDHTAFYQVVPALHWAAVLEAQAEMLGSPVFDEASVDAERSVIVEETRMSELNPPVFAWRRLTEMVFRDSGYGRSITGTEETLSGIDGRALAGHFDRWYEPTNMVQVVVGDVDGNEVIAQAREFLGRGGDAGADRGADARAEGRQDVSSPPTRAPEWTPWSSVVSGNLRQPYLIVGFPAPPVCDPDMPVLDVLCSLLGLGRSSRLRKSLQTKAGLVSDISASVVAHRDVGVVAVSAVGTLDASPPAIVEGLFSEIGRLRDTPVAVEEMRKSVRRLEAGYVLEHETVESAAMTLGFFETMGGHRYAEEYIDRLAAVTADDVKRAANTYLNVDAAAMLAYVPEGSRAVHDGSSALVSAAQSGSRSAIGSALRERWSSWSAEEEFTRPLIARETASAACGRRTLSNGATLIVRESAYVPLVSVALAFRGGFADEPDALLGVTNLTLKHMLRGTVTRSASLLADDIEGLGSAISVSVDRDGFGVGASVLSKHLDEALDVLCEAVCLPVFDAGDFEGVRAEALAELGEAEDHPFNRTMLRLVPLLFPGHPYGRPIAGTTETLSRMSSERTAEWHSERFSARNLYVCMTGDVSIDRAAHELERALEDLPSSAESLGELRAPPPPAGQIDERLDRKGQSSVAVGFQGPRMGTRDSAAMHVVSGALTMMGGRLWRELRERPPFAYSVRAMPVALREGGALVGYVTTQSGQEEAAVRTFVSEFSKLSRDGLSEDELERGRRHLAGMLEISMQRGAARAASYILAEVAGVGYEHIDRLPAMVRGITGGDVIRVARQYLTAEDGPAMAILRG
ncbi:MAG: pitrilysin family protein [Candidatus Eisenbacteria bacterium]